MSDEFMGNAYTPKTQKGLGGNIFLWVIAATLVIGLIMVGGWRLHWWLTGKAVNYQSHIIRNSYSNQQTLRDQITQQISNILSINTQLTQTNNAGEQAALRAQRIAIGGILCQQASEVVGDPLPVQQQDYINRNCFAGTANPNATWR